MIHSQHLTDINTHYNRSFLLCTHTYTRTTHTQPTHIHIHTHTHIHTYDCILRFFKFQTTIFLAPAVNKYCAPGANLQNWMSDLCALVPLLLRITCTWKSGTLLLCYIDMYVCVCVCWYIIVLLYAKRVQLWVFVCLCVVCVCVCGS